MCDTIIWPILPKHDERLLEFRGPIYSSKSFLPFFVALGVIYSVRYALLGVGIAVAAKLPAQIGYLLAIGTPLFSFGSMFGKYQAYPRTVGNSLFAAGLQWLYILMIS